MNNRNKLIELFIYIVIVVVGIVLLLTGGADDKTSAENMGGESYAVVLKEVVSMKKLNEVRLHAKPVDCDVCME